MSDQLTEWALALFRPVLKQLKVQDLRKEPSIVRASEHPSLIQTGMERWIIIARQSAFFKEGEKGCVSIAFDNAHELFLLSINVNDNLFVDNSHELRTQRKMVAIHEFVHGSAHMFTSTFLPPNNYVEILNKSMSSKVKMTTDDEYDAILKLIRQPGAKGGEPFTDGHYRLVVDGFGGNYSELYINLLLSYQLVTEVMISLKKQHKKTSINFSELLKLTIDELVDKKALDKEFVQGRIVLFLPRLFSDFR